MGDMEQGEQEVLQTVRWMIQQCEEVFNVAFAQLDNFEIAFEKALEWLDNKICSSQTELNALKKYDEYYQAQYALEIGKKPRNEEKCELLLEFYKYNHSRVEKLENEIYAGNVVKRSMMNEPKPWQTKDNTLEFSQTTTQQTTIHRHKGR